MLRTGTTTSSPPPPPVPPPPLPRSPPRTWLARGRGTDLRLALDPYRAILSVIMLLTISRIHSHFPAIAHRGLTVLSDSYTIRALLPSGAKYVGENLKMPLELSTQQSCYERCSPKWIGAPGFRRSRSHVTRVDSRHIGTF